MAAPPPRSWRLTQASTNYLISTSPTLLSHPFLQFAFSHKDMYWAKPLPASDLALLLSSSLNLGLYIMHARFPAAKSISEPSSPREESPTVSLSGADDDILAEENGDFPDPSEAELEQIGFARFITDHVTTFYLTDVFVTQEYRGKGLAKWLIACCEEIMSEKPHLRRALLMASPGDGVQFYQRELGMTDIAEESAKTVCMTRRKYDEKKTVE